jgi:hypothetical protein
LEKNTLSIIPDLPNLIYWNISSSVGLISEHDTNARNLLGVSSYTFYPTSSTYKINEGLLKGSITPIVKEQDLPKDYENFIVGKINQYSSKELRAIVGKDVRSHYLLIFLTAVVSFAIAMVIAWFFVRRRCRK